MLRHSACYQGCGGTCLQVDTKMMVRLRRCCLMKAHRRSSFWCSSHTTYACTAMHEPYSCTFSYENTMGSVMQCKAPTSPSLPRPDMSNPCVFIAEGQQEACRKALEQPKPR